MYQIDSATNRKTAPRMSAFPRKIRPFTEPVTANTDLVIGPGATLPDLIRKYHPGAVPIGFSGSFGFLSRDDKVRSYDPGVTDRYVFRNRGSVSQFHEEALKLISKLCDLWTDLGYPLKMDDDRGVMFPDSSAVLALLKKGASIPRLNDVYFILANADIMKKACIVRTVNAGWWAVSFAGRTSPNKSYFRTSMNAHKRAIHAIMRSRAGRSKYEELWQQSADPILTNPGYPFFTAQVDKDGNPVTRIKTVELFAGLVSRSKGSWEDLLTEVDKRAGRFGMEGHPFAIAPLRRLQPGYKWQHQFSLTPSGLRSAFDERGVNSQRVAHMVPYVYNVLTSPVSTMYKAVRYFLPGCYHDGNAKRSRLAQLKEQQSKDELWLAEADYSNFDRFMPVDMIEEIVGWFTELTTNPKYWHAAMFYLHQDASLIWPDYSSQSQGAGWLFKPGSLGLLSGVKATSETGTLVNSVVNGEALARAYNWSEDDLYQYLTMYLDAPIGSREEYYYVQSDDTQLISRSGKLLQKHGELFMDAVNAAGLKGSFELADRFLMRHMQGGGDRPVPARVWQNTLSNESPPESEVVFLAGLAARTDGCFGAKSVDAFGTGTLVGVSRSEAEFTLAILSSLKSFITIASHVSSTAVELLDLLITMGNKMLASPGVVLTADMGILSRITSLRSAINATLAKLQLEEAGGGANVFAPNGAVTKWLYELYRDKSMPSAASILDELVHRNSMVAKQLQVFASKEEAFFRYAAKTIGVTANAFDL